MKSTLKYLFHLFCTITTFQLLFISLSRAFVETSAMIYMKDLYRFPLIGFLSALPSVIFHWYDSSSSKMLWKFLYGFHLLATLAIVLGCLYFFHWLERGSLGTILLIFVVIYGTAYVIGRWKEKQLTKQLNEKLKSFHEGNES